MDLKIEKRRASATWARARGEGIRFDSFFRVFPRPIYIWQYQNDHFILVDYNETGEDYLSDLSEAIFPSQLSQPASDGAAAIEDMRRCYLEKSQYKREVNGYHLPGSGEVKDLVVTYAFIEPDYVMMSVKDVTDERAMLNALKRLSNAVEQTADAVFITDRLGVIEYVNPAFEAVTGYERAEVLGKTPRILKSGEMPPAYYEKMWETILNGKAFYGQTINHRRDGSKLIVEQTITPMRDQSGEITHFVSLLKDVTERMYFLEQETEHRLAGKVQRGLFPKQAPKIRGYDIAGDVFPASNTSGDCFDFIPMRDESTGIVVGDVCGHGMGSALIMAETRAYLRSITRFISEPRQVLRELHNQIQADLYQTGFITMLLARLDPRSHTLQYANAGNWPAYILNSKGEVSQELRPHGLPIGVAPDLDLSQSEPIPIMPGSIVVFMTDGIPEARNEADKGFGVEKLLDTIRKNRRLPAKEIIRRVREAVNQFTGGAEQTDDQTIVICKRRIEVNNKKEKPFTARL